MGYVIIFHLLGQLLRQSCTLKCLPLVIYNHQEVLEREAELEQGREKENLLDRERTEAEIEEKLREYCTVQRQCVRL